MTKDRKEKKKVLHIQQKIMVKCFMLNCLQKKLSLNVNCLQKLAPIMKTLTPFKAFNMLIPLQIIFQKRIIVNIVNNDNHI